jgi:phosphonatase-like hydrolase
VSRFSLVIFDIAGTLIEDHNEVSDAFLEALLNNAIEVSDTEIKEWKGSAKREVITHFVARQFGPCRNQALIDRTYSEFRYLLEQKYSPDHIIPIRGAEATLQEVRRKGLKLATTTGFYREVRDTILRNAQWQNTFDVNICSDDVSHGRPAPDMIYRAMEQTGVSDPKRVITIGDTPLDLQSGSSAGCGLVIGVLTGSHTLQRLEREPHTHILPSVAEVTSLLD